MGTMTFTGHRPDKLGGFDLPNTVYRRVTYALDDILTRFRPELGICGMAIGFDQWAAELLIDHNIPFVAAIPFEGQEGRWPDESQDRYFALLEKAHQKVLVCSGGYAPWKMQKRNEWMVNFLKTPADYLTSTWDGTDGGTKNCLDYAAKRRGAFGFQWINIDPRFVA